MLDQVPPVAAYFLGVATPLLVEFVRARTGRRQLDAQLREARAAEKRAYEREQLTELRRAVGLAREAGKALHWLGPEGDPLSFAESERLNEASAEWSEASRVLLAAGSSTGDPDLRAASYHFTRTVDSAFYGEKRKDWAAGRDAIVAAGWELHQLCNERLRTLYDS
jgi:hypothetical protein